MDVLKEIKNKVISDEWIESKSKGRGGVGITLESLLQKPIENFEIPDYKGIELKAKCSKKETHISLFSAVPDSYLFEIKRLLHEYGYPDSQYPEYKTFNLSVYGHRKIKFNNYYFKLYVDWKNRQIFLRIYDTNCKIIDEFTSWSFDLLQEKLERKLNKLAIIHAERKFEHNVIYFKYTSIDFYQLNSFNRFLRLIENGMIRITFRIGFYKDKQRFGKIYDHGTSFSIDEKNICRLFDKIYVEDQGK